MKAEDDFEVQRLSAFQITRFWMLPFFQPKDVQILLLYVMFLYKRKCTEMYWFLEELPTIDTPTSKITSSFANKSVTT